MLRTLLYIIATIFIGLVIIELAFKVAVWGAIIGLVLFLGLVGYLLSMFFRRK